MKPYRDRQGAARDERFTMVEPGRSLTVAVRLTVAFDTGDSRG